MKRAPTNTFYFVWVRRDIWANFAIESRTGELVSLYGPYSSRSRVYADIYLFNGLRDYQASPF